MQTVITSSEHTCGLWTLLYNVWLMDPVIRIVITLSEHACGLWTLLYELLSHQLSTLVACRLYYTNYHIKWAHLWLTDSVIQIITSSEHNCASWSLLYKLSHQVSTVVLCDLCYTNYHIKWTHLWLMDSVIQIITSSEHTCGLWTLLCKLLSHQVSTLVAYGLCYTICGLWALL